jgi:hypothetical protein
MSSLTAKLISRLRVGRCQRSVPYVSSHAEQIEPGGGVGL